MACKDCKKKSKDIAPKEVMKMDKMEIIAKGFLIMLTLFALFGIYSFINLFL